MEVGDLRRGLGRALLAAVIARARGAGKHAMVAAIEAGNAPSIRLHESLGFVPVGTMPQVGQKFGRWLDLALLPPVAGLIGWATAQLSVRRWLKRLP